MCKAGVLILSQWCWNPAAARRNHNQPNQLRCWPRWWLRSWLEKAEGASGSVLPPAGEATGPVLVLDKNTGEPGSCLVTRWGLHRRAGGTVHRGAFRRSRGVGLHHPTSLDAAVGLAVNNFFHFLPLIYCLGESCGRRWTGFKKTGLSPHKNLDVCEVGRREVQ